MVLSKSILVKGLVGLGTVVGATTLGVVYRNEIGGLFTKKESGKGEADDVVVGGAAGASNDKGGQGGETTPEAAVAGDKGSAGGVKKEVTLESFKEEIKNLGISEEDCKLDNLEGEKTCTTFNKDSLKKLMFPFKEEGKDLVIKPLNDDNDQINVVLKVKKANDQEIFTSGTKYIIEVTGESAIIELADSSKQIVLYSGTNPEFTVKEGKLVRAWDAEKLGKKVGLTCVKEEGKEEISECSFEKQIKIIKDGKVKALLISSVDKEEERKIEVSSDTVNYNQGFKFTYRKQTITGSDDVKLEKDTTYEIKYVDGKNGEKGG